MSRSRWGGFLRSRINYTDFWDTLKTVKAATLNVDAPDKITDFNYTSAQGIWNLNSTVSLRAELPTTVPTPETPAYTTGFSSSLDTITGQNNAWLIRNVDISAYAGATVRLVFEYRNGSSFTGDIQLDNINIDGNVYSFESTGESFETSAAGETSYGTVSWNPLAVATTNARWNVDTGGTGSGGTGRTDAADGNYYVYAETSSPANVTGYEFWLRSPQITLGSSPTLSYYEARLGAGIGTLNVYLDVIA